ncbi:hypothetical protein D3C80_1148620 [compost metagenome]
MGVVSAQHQGLHPQVVELENRFTAAVAHRIGYGEQGQHRAFPAQGHHCLALGFQGVQARFQLFRAESQLFDQPMITQVIAAAFDLAGDATAG